MKYLVLGSGLQGRVVAYDIIKFEQDATVVIADIDSENLKLAKSLIKEDRLSVEEFDITDSGVYRRADEQG